MTTILRAIPMNRIENIWQSLRSNSPGPLVRRIDETHPLDIYAEYEHPDRPGLVLVCPDEPPRVRDLKAVRIDHGDRADGRWWLRLSLMTPDLFAVFQELCRDIVTFTRQGITPQAAPGAILARVDRWRRLLEEAHDGMTPTALRGLIGELLVLEADVLPHFRPEVAVRSWQGPLGAAQDFRLPSGRRIEVKVVQPDPEAVRINGLAQLDGEGEEIVLTIVRLADVHADSDNMMTTSTMIRRLIRRLDPEPLAANEFTSRLAAAGWHEHPLHEQVAVILKGMDRYVIEDPFPRLVRARVPVGVIEADYLIALPPMSAGNRAAGESDT